MGLDEQFFKDWGAMQQSIKTIERRTEKIDSISDRILLAENTLTDIKPKVEKHETTHQRAVGVAFIVSILLTGLKEACLAFLEGGRGGHAG